MSNKQRRSHNRLIVRLCCLTCICLFVVRVSAQEPKLPTPAEIREANVYEAIADMAVRRDDLLQKFAVVMHGEATSLGTDIGPVIRPAVNVRLVDRSRRFDMSTGYTVVTNEGPHYEMGNSTIQIGTTHNAIDHNPVVQPVLIKPPGTKLSDWRKHHPLTGGADPFDDYLFGASAFSGSHNRAIEEAVLRRYKLAKTETGIGGKLISHWTWNPNKYCYIRIKMEFDPAYSMMPVSVETQNRLIKNDFQDTRITWRKHGKALLPYRIEFAYGDMTRDKASTECTFRCYWFVGDEVPDDVFEPEQPDDHLGALLDHVGITRSRRINGKVVRTNHELPTDLHEDAKKRSK